MDIGGKMRESKFKYVIKRKNGWTFSETFTLKQIEKGEALLFLKINNVGENEIHKYQYTGRKDKHRKEIFEGDKDDEHGVVVYDNEYLGFFCRPNYPNKEGDKPLYDCPLFEIIGTIHDMPKA